MSFKCIHRCAQPPRMFSSAQEETLGLILVDADADADADTDAV